MYNGIFPAEHFVLGPYICVLLLIIVSLLYVLRTAMSLDFGFFCFNKIKADRPLTRDTLNAP